ncbi:NB-ARC domains-containing protein [Tanacetum coccineum]
MTTTTTTIPNSTVSEYGDRKHLGRGEDIRKSFMDHLFNDFKQKGIHAFRDDRELPKGEEISPHLYKAIEESRFLIVIFSKNYASSSWCLRELVKILECKEMGWPKHEVQILFYDVKPDVVRKQTESYAEAFAKHHVSNRPEVDSWKEALSMAANLSGWDLQDMTNGHKMTWPDLSPTANDWKDHENRFEDFKYSLAGSASWFCPGSLIIFTCQDKQLLRSRVVDEIHDMKFLDEDQSLELFGSYAFKTKDSSRGFKEVAEEVVKYVQGHPLALKVLGRFLNGKTVGQYKYTSLVDKALIMTSSNNSLQMHDLIQAMASGIVSEESSMPGNRSRFWVNPLEIYNILSEKKATQAVEILDIQHNKSSQKFNIDGAAFAQMKNLRILKIPKDDAVNFFGRLDFLSNNLRLLYWHGCPFKLLPSDFYPENIVVISLFYSNIKQLWTTPKCLRRLKVMKLRYCCNLTTTPDFSEITSLEELDLEGCVNLVTVHPSIGMIKRLVVLNMRDCRRARSFPSKVEMDYLQVLNLLGYLNVNQPPEAFWSRWWTFGLPSKQHPQRPVSLAGNNFSSLPGSLSQLSHLETLFVDDCKKLEVLPELPYSSCSTNRFSSFFPYAGFQNKICEFFRFPGSSIYSMDIIYDGNGIPEWFTNKSIGNHVKVGLPSDWCYDKLKGFGTCVVLKRKRVFSTFKGYIVNNFDGALLGDWLSFYNERPIRINESYMIWLHYTTATWKHWKKAKNFVTFCFKNEDIEVKECGVRLVCDEDLEQDVINSSMFLTLSQHGQAIRLTGPRVIIRWSGSQQSVII